MHGLLFGSATGDDHILLSIDGIDAWGGVSIKGQIVFPEHVARILVEGPDLCRRS